MIKTFNIYLLAKRILPLLLLAAVVLPVHAADLGFGTPSIKITSPSENATLPAGDVTITVSVDDLKLANKLGAANVDGEGHVHYFMDAMIPTTLGKPAITAVGTYVPTANTSYTWKNVMSGRHNFSVELVNNDHTPLNPPKFAQINVTVTGNATLAQTSANMATYNASTTGTSMTQATSGTTIDLAAKNLAFDKSIITVPAGAKVTVNFDNQDNGMPHNLAVYTDSSATNMIFKGNTITGPSKTTYTFTAPTKPGTYFFRCDIHPTQMTGQFIVQ